jgi:hypothetical protein
MPQWATPIALTAAQLEKVPPQDRWRERTELYLRWAERTQWRGFAPEGLAATDPTGHDLTSSDEPEVGIIARARNRKAFDRLLADPDRRLRVPDFYRHALPGSGGKWSPYFTARVCRKHLDWLKTQAHLLQWELAVSVRPVENVSHSTTVGRYGPSRDAAHFARNATLKALKGGAALTDQGSIQRPCLAVIDFGGPFLNECFARGGGGTRFVALWDQDEVRSKRAPWWASGTALPYGRELGAQALEAITRQTKDPHHPREETEIYRELDYMVARRDARRRVWIATHGAHVTATVGGGHDPLAALTGGGDSDAASDADLLFVQLPGLTAGDCSGGSLSAHVLDGVRYALDRCNPHVPLVLTLCYGTYAGPHDGSSLIERALDDLLKLRKRNFAVVLAAGNAQDAGCHVRREVCPGKSALLRMALTPADTTDTFMELWYARAADGSALRVRVRTAGRDWSEWVQPGQEVTLRDDATHEPLALLTSAHDVAHGDRSLVLLALAPTAARVNDDGPLNVPGLWELEVALLTNDKQSVVFDAWIERDDPNRFNTSPGAAQCAFVGLDAEDTSNTLSSLATGSRTVVVTGYRWSDGLLADYASLPAVDAPPRALPLMAAPCEEDLFKPGIRACAVRSGDSHLMGGSSVAAPVLARRLFNHWLDLPAAQRVVSAGLLEDLARASQGVIRAVDSGR